MSQEMQDQQFEILFDRLKAVLPTGGEAVRVMSLLLSLPQSIERMKRAKFDLQRSQKDVLTALDMLSDYIGKYGEAASEEDFKQMKNALSDINLFFTDLAAKARDD